jgi:predicted amidohydrolase
MRTAVVQLEASTDVDVNLEAIGHHLEDAAGAGAQLVVLPEASMHDFGAPDLPLGPVAQPLDGPFVVSVGELARKADVTVVVGMFERSDDPARPYNTLAVLGRDGDVVHRYRKAHLYDSFGYRESDRLSAGPFEPVVVPMGEFTLGLMTCYDLRFPEVARALVDEGADVLVAPSAWVRGPLKEDHWTTLLRARAIENTVYVVGAGQTGKTYVGRSAVVDPMGVPVASMGAEQGYAVADLRSSYIAEVRRSNPSLANRRL